MMLKCMVTSAPTVALAHCPMAVLAVQHLKPSSSWPLHVRSTKGGTHGEVPTDAKATVSSVSPWCRAVFASERAARTHIRMAIRKCECSGMSSNHTFTIAHPQSLECSLCLREHENVESLLACITTHVAGPYILVPCVRLA